jgi:hypothetical protein
MSSSLTNGLLGAAIGGAAGGNFRSAALGALGGIAVGNVVNRRPLLSLEGGKEKMCTKDQIMNPKTGRCVSKKGKIGKSLLAGGGKGHTPYDALKVGTVLGHTVYKNDKKHGKRPAGALFIIRYTKVYKNSPRGSYAKHVYDSDWPQSLKEAWILGKK